MDGAESETNSFKSPADCHDWLYPEILSKEDLIKTLKQRYIKHTDLALLDKADLVELYYKYIIPLPQRKFRQNRRGREMTKKQIILAKKRKASTAAESGPSKKKSEADEKNSRFMTSYNIPSSSGERIKPPPSCIDHSKKKIKLNSKQNHSEKAKDSGIDIISFKTFKSDDKEKSQAVSVGNDKTLHSLKNLDRKGISSPEMKTTIKLINKQLALSSPQKKSKLSGKDVKQETDDQVETDKMDTSSAASTKKKVKINKISWP